MSGIAQSTDNNRVYWLCQLGGWSVFCAFQAWIAVRLLRLPVDVAIADYSVAFVLLVTGTHALRIYSKRHRWALLSMQALVLHILAASLVLSAVLLSIGFAIAVVLSQVGIDLRLTTDQPSAISAGVAFANLQIYLSIWMALYFGYSVLRQRQYAKGEEARLRAALRTAELNLLKSQLNPHFLFNALNTVRALIAESPHRAELAVTQLARTLRYSLNSSHDELVTLEHELDIVKDYLGIETLRLAERLTIVQEVDAATLPAEIPIMLLQTLVENAVKHGISQLPKGGTLRIAARMEGTTLIIEVTNDRPLIKSGSIPSDRVGLANANERLRLMIGPTATLALDLSHPERAIATVRIPQGKA
jgi:sensor histidine kinase YesM